MDKKKKRAKLLKKAQHIKKNNIPKRLRKFITVTWKSIKNL